MHSLSLKPSHPYQSSPSYVRKSPLTIWVVAISHVLTIQPIWVSAQPGPWASTHHLLLGVTVRKCPQLSTLGHYQEDKVTLYHKLGPPQRQRVSHWSVCVPSW